MNDKKLKVTAIVAIRNGAFYFSRLCQYARDNEFSLAVIDNESEDDIQSLIEQNMDVIDAFTTLKYNGYFDLCEQLKKKQELAQTLTSDWFIHLDVDEFLFSDIQGETLQASLKRVQDAGFNAVNFDEFVFLPIQRFKKFKPNNYHTMSWYYFFEPKPNRLTRAFHSSLKIDKASGGHKVEGDLKLYPENMIMRHYMFENREHSKKKYKYRFYSDQDIKNGFHGNRLLMQNRRLYLPRTKSLLQANEGDWCLNKSEPKAKHFWEW